MQAHWLLSNNLPRFFWRPRVRARLHATNTIVCHGDHELSLRWLGHDHTIAGTIRLQVSFERSQAGLELRGNPLAVQQLQIKMTTRTLRLLPMQAEFLLANETAPDGLGQLYLWRFL